MAASTCPKCGSISFELKAVEPRNAKYKLHFIQCASCGTPVGVKEYNNIGAMLDKQNQALKRIAAALNVYVDL